MLSSSLTPYQAALVLNGIPGVGPVALRRLSDAFSGDLPAILSAGFSRLAAIPGIGKTLAEKICQWQEFFDLEKEEREIAKRGVKFIPFFDEAFPPLLREIADPPVGLYVAGEISAVKTKKAVALVGTRKASLYGTANAEKIAAGLARAGWCVVSGGARGIDTAAHSGALNTGGQTVAVLGCGLDIVYPPENFELFKKISSNGGAVVSEFPFGKKADKRTFPQRNRIVAGMSAGTLVVESDIAGGSIITANFAGECGRTVFALPGRVEQAGSRGCHKLIRDGATLVTSAEDILEDLTGSAIQTVFDFEKISASADGNGDSEENFSAGTLEKFSGNARKILEALRDGSSLSPDALSVKTGLSFPDVSSELLLLELDRVVARKADGTYEIDGRQ